jgi:hypothetical protein
MASICWRSSPRRPVTGDHLPNAPGGAKRLPKFTKKMQLHRFAILPRVNEDLYARPSNLWSIRKGPTIISLDAKPEHMRGGVRVNIDQTCGVRAVQLTVPELQLSSRSLVSAMRAPDMPAVDMPVTATLTRGRPHAHLRQQNTKLISWRGKGEVCPQPTTTAVQGGRIAGYGAYDVTDSKFSTKWRPPSCSPPV